VDGASGAFLAPFCVPDLLFDFRLPRVKSISTSGHKFGPAPLGVGWVLFRDAEELPEDPVFHVNYLGGDMPDFQINPETGIPTVTWRIAEGADPGYTLFDLADRLRARGWQVPAYTLTGTASTIAVQRILVRLGVSRDIASLLLGDFRNAIAHFDRHPVTVPLTHEESAGFNHMQRSPAAKAAASSMLAWVRMERSCSPGWRRC
jgi:glutamate decarboxylase